MSTSLRYAGLIKEQPSGRGEEREKTVIFDKQNETFHCEHYGDTAGPNYNPSAELQRNLWDKLHWT